jgi:hypothetical protein
LKTHLGGGSAIISAPLQISIVQKLRIEVDRTIEVDIEHQLSPFPLAGITQQVPITCSSAIAWILNLIYFWHRMGRW